MSGYNIFTGSSGLLNVEVVIFVNLDVFKDRGTCQIKVILCLYQNAVALKPYAAIDLI